MQIEYYQNTNFRYSKLVICEVDKANQPFGSINNHKPIDCVNITKLIFIGLIVPVFFTIAFFRNPIYREQGIYRHEFRRMLSNWAIFKYIFYSVTNDFFKVLRL